MSLPFAFRLRRLRVQSTVCRTSYLSSSYLNYHRRCLFHASPCPRALPFLSTIGLLSKPTIIFMAKILLQVGRPIFFAWRWIWFLIPRRLRGRMESFFHHHYFNQMSRWNVFAFCSTLWFLVWLSYFENIEEVPYSFRRRFSYIKMQDLYEESMEASNQLLTSNEENMVPDTHPITRQIQQVVDTLSNMARINGILDMQFKVHVVDSPELNAMVLPNGDVFVFTGILEIFDDSDSLGILLGHEMAHVIAAHSAESLCRESNILMMDALWFMLLSLFVPSNYMFGVQEWFRLQMMELVTDLPFSRANETEADYIGLILARQCGYDVRKGPSLWNAMHERDGDNLPEIFNTHPDHQNRSKYIHKWLPHVHALKHHCTVF